MDVTTTVIPTAWPTLRESFDPISVTLWYVDVCIMYIVSFSCDTLEIPVMCAIVCFGKNKLYGIAIIWSYCCRMVDLMSGNIKHSPLFQVHTSCEGSVLHCPELLQVAVISAAGEKPGSHWKVITEPSVVIRSVKFKMTPFTGSLGNKQLPRMISTIQSIWPHEYTLLYWH